MGTTVNVHREGGVATVALNRPDALNALTSEMMDYLPGVLRELAEDPGVGCVVLTGAGRGFCAGGDLKARQAEIDAEADLPEVEQLVNARADVLDLRLRRKVEASKILHTMPKPTIAMVNGPCAGAGFCLAGACDLRIAGESAFLTSAFTKAGLSGDYGGTYYWTKILGTAAARELYFLSERITAREALRRGMVHRLYPDGELSEQVMAMAHRIADGPAWAYAYAKRNLNLAEEAPLDQVLQSEVTTMGLAARTTREAGLMPVSVLAKSN